jgi:ligand-binding SRPBCC domain-containing protein
VSPRRYHIEREQFISRPLEEVFPFFSDARNLERLTPDFLRFEILAAGPIRMAAGTVIDYRIRLFGLPRRWRTLIEVFEPPRRFIDVQVSGPYAAWRHLHEFEAAPGGTRMRDRVDYAMPFGPVGALARALFVRRTLERIFDFRREKVLEIFGGPGGDGTRG